MNPIQKQAAKYRRILAKDVWSKTPLLRVFRDRMSAMLDRLLALETGADWEGVPVCVLLYHQKGGELLIWQDMLHKIQYSVNGRPVYLSERDAQAAIGDPLRESYVVLTVSKNAVVLDNGQYYLKESSVSPEMVKAFFWDGKTFHFNGSELMESETVV